MSPAFTSRQVVRNICNNLTEAGKKTFVIAFINEKN